MPLQIPTEITTNPKNAANLLLLKSRSRCNSTSGSPGPELDPGDPVAIVAGRGITPNNRTDLDSLVRVLESYGNWQNDVNNSKSSLQKMTMEMAAQLYAVTRLLQEALTADGPVTKSDPCQAIEDIKASGIPNIRTLMYARIVNEKAPVSKPPPNPDVETKKIFISMVQVPKTAEIYSLTPR